MALPRVIEHYLAELAEEMERAGVGDERLLSEIADHLLEDMERRGGNAADASGRAVDALGPARELVDTYLDYREELMAMPSKLTQTSGLVGIAGFAAMAVAMATSSRPQWAHPFGWSVPLFAVLAVALLAVALLGVAARLRRRFGALGWGGLAVMAAGFFPALLRLPTLPLVAVGVGLFAAAVWRSRVYPTGPLVLLGLGGVSGIAVAVVGTERLAVNAAPVVSLACGWLWLCYALWSERPERPAPVSA